jgi:RNA-directed DNA polymerase
MANLYLHGSDEMLCNDEHKYVRFADDFVVMCRTRSGSLESIIRELNPILRGWFEYFMHAHRSTFRAVDGFVQRRLRALLRKREKRPGFGRTSSDYRRWPNAFFAKHGLFTLQEAYAAASQSRKGNC